MATYKPYKKTTNGKEEVQIPASSVSGLAKVATSGSYNDLSNKPPIPDISGLMPKSGGTFTGEVKFGSTENFQGYYIKRMIGSLGIGTAYANLDSSYKDGTWHRMWRLRFPSGSNFWGKIKITLYGGYSSFNASGVMSKSITCNFNTSSIYNNVGCYDGLGVNVEQDFRISEAIWNSTASAWEVLIWQKNLSGNNSPVIMLECWTANNPTYINAFNGITAQPVELTQSTSYSAQKASSTGGTKTVTWATLPVYENPLGEEIATMSDLSNKANLSGGNTFTGKQTLNSPDSDGYSINAAGYVKGSWLQAPSTGHVGSGTNKVCVLSDNGWIYYRTPSEILEEAGGATTSDLSGKLDKSGGTVTGNLTVGGNLTINGTTTTVDSTTLQVKDKLIEVAHGNTAVLTTPAGLVAPKYDGTNSGALVFDSTGTAYVGDVTLKDGNIDVANSGLQPLATRTGLVGGNLVQYDSSALTLKDSGKKISDLATTSQVNAKYTKPSGGIPKTDLANAVQTSLGKADNALSTDGGTIKKSKTIKMDASANSNGANIKWGTVNSKNPYIGYASDQTDGTFVVGSLLGTNYASGLAIGGGSGNLLWKGTKVATINDIPPKVTESTVSGWGFTKNKGTVTSVSVKMNGEIKGTITSSGTIDLGALGGTLKWVKPSSLDELSSITTIFMINNLVVDHYNVNGICKALKNYTPVAVLHCSDYYDDDVNGCVSAEISTTHGTTGTIHIYGVLVNTYNNQTVVANATSSISIDDILILK